jgi:threonine/homoserine/homoserine lactone efflux protein
VLLKGLVIGFSIASRVGPFGVLVIKRTLSQGRIYGIVLGVGAASVDAVYGLIAGLDLNFITKFFKETPVLVSFSRGSIPLLFRNKNINI